MADSVDNFSDLQELGIDVNESTDNLSISFTKAADHLQKLLPNVDNETLLTLYGYYKQGTQGICNAPKPSWYDLKAKSKWESWRKLGNMPESEAKQRYVDVLKSLDPTFDNQITETSDHWVKVSSMCPQQDDKSERTIVDYIREANINKIENYVKLNGPNSTNEGLHLIHWAADLGNTDVLRKLVELGATVNLTDDDGQTALHYAASCGHSDCVKFLLEKGADKSAVDNDGNKPCDVAADTYISDLLK